MSQSGLAELLQSRMAAKSGSTGQQQPAPVSDNPVEAPVAVPDKEHPPEVAAEESEHPVEALEGDDSDASVTGDEEQSEPEEQSAPESYDVESFSRAVGWEPADLYENLEVPIRQPDGTFVKAKLGDLKDGLESFQDQVTALQQAQRQFAEQVRAFETSTLTEHQAQTQAEQEASDALAQIRASYHSQNWDELVEKDPGRAAFMRQQYGIAVEEAQNALNQAKAKADEQRNQVRAKAIAEHNQVLARLVPQWRNPETYQQEAPQVEQFLVSQLGFRPDELSTIFDGRARAAARLAWIGWKHLQEVEQGTQRIRQAPKPVLKPGAGNQRQDPQDREIKTLRERANQTGRREDKTALAAAVLKRGMARQSQSKATRRKR